MVDWILGVIGGLLYPLFSIIYVCIDGLQGLFYALAGIGNVSFGASNNWGGGESISAGNSGALTDTGLINYLFQYPLVKNLLMSIMLLALFLIIIFTVMAFIKNAYSAKQKGWKEIIGNSIKGLANFIFIPVCCLLGVWLANILLQAINGATSGTGGGTQMSRKLFIAAAYNSNEFRNPDMTEEELNEKVAELKEWLDDKSQGWHTLKHLETGESFTMSSADILDGKDAEYYANIVDQIHQNYNRDIYSWWAVEKWYSLWEVNYIVLVVGGVFMLYALGSLAFAMVRRMFLLVILFIVSPGMCAMYPLDEGKAVGQWKDNFIKNVLSAHGSVAAINIFYALLPLIDNIHFASAISAVGVLDDLLQVFILTVGLMCVKEFTGLLSGFIGGEDAFNKGTSIMKESKEKAKSGFHKATRFAGTVSPYAAGAAKTFFDVNAAMGKSIGSGVSKGVDKAKAHHEENKALSYAKRNDMYKTDAEGNVVDEYDTAAARKAMAAEKQGKLEAKASKKAGKLVAKELKRGIKDEDKISKLMETGMSRQQAEYEYLFNSNESKKQQKQVEKNERKEERKEWKKGRAERLADGTATLGDTFADAWSKTKKGARSAIRTAYEESGAKKVVDEYVDEWHGSRDRLASRDKAIAAGPGGKDKAAATMKKIMDKGDYDASTLVTAGGTAGAAALNIVLSGGKFEIDGKELDIKSTYGVDPKSPTAAQDLSYFDQTMNKMATFAKRINEAQSLEVKAMNLKAAGEFAANFDAQGNSVLESAMQDFANQIAEAIAETEKDQDKVKNGETVELKNAVKIDETSIKGMAEASKELGQAVHKALSTNVSKLLEEIRKLNKDKK